MNIGMLCCLLLLMIYIALFVIDYLTHKRNEERRQIELMLLAAEFHKHARYNHRKGKFEAYWTREENPEKRLAASKVEEEELAEMDAAAARTYLERKIDGGLGV